MKKSYVKNALRIRHLLVTCLVAWVSASAVAASDVSRHYTEGADIRVEVQEGASDGKVVISNTLECPDRSCPPQTLQVPADVVVEDYRRGKTPKSATVEQLREWGLFYGEAAYVKEKSGQLRATRIVRTQRPVGQ